MKKFNKDKYLKKLKLKRFWQSNSRYFYIGVPCILCGILGIYFAYSKFFVTQEDAVVQTSVGNFIYGDVIINNYVNGQYTVEAPAQGAGYKVDKIVCDNGATATWDNKDWGPTITNVTRRSKCNIYFVAAEKINIGNVAVPLDAYGLCPTVNADGSATVTEAESTYGYLCSMKDAYGTSYYYRGNVTNNYVKFADKYWRIVRINGDGTVRVIYDGTIAHSNGESSSDREIGATVFNNSSNDNAHVGYMYNTNIIDDSTYENNAGSLQDYEFYISKTYSYDDVKGVFYLENPIKINGKNLTNSYVGYYFVNFHSLSTSGLYLQKILKVHNSSYNVNVEYSKGVSMKSESKEMAQTNSRNSTIKTYLDKWYENNVKGTTNEQYVKDNLFCNDRSLASNNTGTGAGTSVTYYRWYNNTGTTQNSKMMLTCPQKNDAFTVNDTTKGNGVLTYGIGLLTADEVALAGGWGSSNYNYYLYSGQNYWLASPYYFSGSSARGLDVYSRGTLSSSYVSDSRGARPVFNLTSDILKNGDGTSSNPYHA